MNDPIAERARALHQRALVWDAHCDALQRVIIDDLDLGPATEGQCDLAAWKAGGVKAGIAPSSGRPKLAAMSR